ncbi:MAG TPA: hypothetical protein VGS28_04910 [Candidatus Saccharimonadales bacterium]|nr:hypothetical protein [Candidatus Saccharimonadales bacterium]
MNKLMFVRFVATTAASLGLVGGMSAVAFAHGDHNHHDNGSSSVVLNADNGNVKNNNHVNVANLSGQVTQSGDASVSSGQQKHDHGDDNAAGSNAAVSGDASATVGQSNSVDISSSAQPSMPSAAPASDPSGEGGSNSLVVNVDNGNVNNNNDVNALNGSFQLTQSGNAKVTGSNTSGSSASSGDASSSATQSNSVTISE